MSTLISILSSIGADEYYVKGWQLSGMELFLIIILIGIIKLRKEKRLNIFLISLCFIPCALIPFESINILWHFGTYYHYPIRCGYLIPFSILTVATAYGGRIFSNTPFAKGSKKRYSILIIIASAMAFALLYFMLMFYVNHNPWTVQELFKLWLIFAAVFSLVYLSLLTLPLFAAALPLLLMELILGAYIGYGRPHFTDRFFSDPEQSGDYVQAAMELKSLLPEPDSGTALLRRIKNPDTDLNTNYGMVLRRPTVTGWANTITLSQQKSAEKLGYGTHFMRILDSGGTVFTDSLLGISEIITRVSHLGDYPFYEKKGEYETSYGSYALYENTAAFPLITAVPGKIKALDLKDISLDKAHNSLYSALGGNEPDFAILIGKEKDGNKNRTISIEGQKALYLIKGKSDEIRVNGEAVPVPTIGDMDNKSYPAWFNNSLIYLGSFKDEAISIDCPASSRLLMLDLKALKDLSGSLNAPGPFTGRNIKTEMRSLSFEINGSTERDMALLPLHADPGLSCSVNGKKTSIYDIGGLLTLIPLSPGINSVELSFIPPGLIPGIALSCIAVLALLFYIFLYKKAASSSTSRSATGVRQDPCPPCGHGAGPLAHCLHKIFRAVLALRRPVYAAVLFTFTIISAMAWLCLYVVPIGFFVVHKICKML